MCSQVFLQKVPRSCRITEALEENCLEPPDRMLPAKQVVSKLGGFDPRPFCCWEFHRSTFAFYRRSVEQERSTSRTLAHHAQRGAFPRCRMHALVRLARQIHLVFKPIAAGSSRNSPATSVSESVAKGSQASELSWSSPVEQLRTTARVSTRVLVKKGAIRARTKARARSSELFLREGLS